MNVKTVRTGAIALALAGIAGAANAQLTFEFSSGPGMDALALTDPGKVASMFAGATKAAAVWSSIFHDPVTLRIALDYAPSLPALGASFATFDPAGTAYGLVKTAMGGDASSPFDATAVGSLQPGPGVKMLINDFFVGPSFPPKFDGDLSINNVFMDLTSSNLKALGLIDGAHGAAGFDGTLKFGSATFDYDPYDGIDAGHYDFVGVVLHELAHNMGFISGVDTVASMVPPPFGPPPMPGLDATVLLTTLDLFRYSSDSLMHGPSIIDVSLPVPGFSPTRFFSIDGGLTPMELFSTGTKLAGDGEQAGHWKLDSTFGLMDPSLAAGFNLTLAFEALLAMGLPPDVIALDVIGWTLVPTPGSLVVLGVAGLALRRRRA